MATAVLHPQDCLASPQNSHRQGFIGVVYHPHTKPSPWRKSPQIKKPGPAHGHGYGGTGSPAHKSKAQDKKRPLKPKPQDEALAETGKRFVKNQNNRNNGLRQDPSREEARNNLVMGQVTILKRGQAVESTSHMMGRLGVSPPKSAAAQGPAFGSRNSARLSRDLRMGFEPVTGGSSGVQISKPVCRPEEWAGPAFANSPSPRCLPFPKFSVKKTSAEEKVCDSNGEAKLAQIDSFATRDLRRLLGLD